MDVTVRKSQSSKNTPGSLAKTGFCAVHDDDNREWDRREGDRKRQEEEKAKVHQGSSQCKDGSFSIKEDRVDQEENGK